MALLEYVHDQGIAELVLNAPPQNRFRGDVTAGLGHAIQDLANRSDTRAVLIRADGPDFSHGGNVSGWIGQTGDEFAAGIAQGIVLCNTLQDLDCPIVVAVQGYCGGGGFELALRGDIIVAADDAKFCHSEASIGAFTFMGGVQRVAERVGRTRAIQWALTAEQVGARTALDAGLINEVVSRADLHSAAMRWVDKFKHGATLAHAAHKKLLRAWSDSGIAASDAIVAAMAGEILESEDTQSCLEA
ncbi:MAG: enoyl-CoA hydratase/isomerase family protein, partial [Pseudomonadota bacterium]